MGQEGSDSDTLRDPDEDHGYSLGGFMPWPEQADLFAPVKDRSDWEQEFVGAASALVSFLRRSRALRAVHLDDRKDIEQDILLGVWRRWDLIRELDEGRRQLYLNQMAHNRVAHYLARRARRLQSELLVSDFEEPDPYDIERVLRSRNVALWHPDLWKAIASLSPNQRAALLYCYWDDCSISEIAKKFGVTEGTVKSHLDRAKGHLRIQLSNRVINRLIREGRVADSGPATERGR